MALNGRPYVRAPNQGVHGALHLGGFTNVESKQKVSLGGVFLEGWHCSKLIHRERERDGEDFETV